MRTRLASWWSNLHDSLWFIPALATGIAVILAFGMVQLDRTVVANGDSIAWWLFGAGVSGAREVLSAIASTMITVTGVVFSITIVALQLASSQFTPRVLRTFTGDRGNQVVLGVFIATFTYSLLVLRTVQEAPTEQAMPFVPAASVSLAIVLALISIGFLIYYINHAANSIRASVIIDRAAGDTLKLIDELFPRRVGRPAPAVDSSKLESAPAVGVCTLDGGYLQAIDGAALFKLAEQHDLLIRIAPEIGDFVLPGAQVASVWPARALPPPWRDGILGAMIFGAERTLQSDIGYGIRQLADIAIKALSPGINDPTTATICIDRLAEALVRLAAQGPPQETRTGHDGRPHLILRGPPFERLVSVAFGQIRHFGASDASVADHLVTILGRMTALVPEERRPPLRREARLVLAAVREQVTLPEDRQRVEDAGAWTLSRDDTPATSGRGTYGNGGGNPKAATGGRGWKSSESDWSASTPRAARSSSTASSCS